eukprot:347684-Chlamydomonas_euryale.AAC.1
MSFGAVYRRWHAHRVAVGERARAALLVALLPVISCFGSRPPPNWDTESMDDPTDMPRSERRAEAKRLKKLDKLANKAHNAKPTKGSASSAVLASDGGSCAATNAFSESNVHALGDPHASDSCGGSSMTNAVDGPSDAEPALDYLHPCLLDDPSDLELLPSVMVVIDPTMQAIAEVAVMRPTAEAGSDIGLTDQGLMAATDSQAGHDGAASNESNCDVLYDQGLTTEGPSGDGSYHTSYAGDDYNPSAAGCVSDEDGAANHTVHDLFVAVDNTSVVAMERATAATALGKFFVVVEAMTVAVKATISAETAVDEFFIAVEAMAVADKESIAADTAVDEFFVAVEAMAVADEATIAADTAVDEFFVAVEAMAVADKATIAAEAAMDEFFVAVEAMAVADK